MSSSPAPSDETLVDEARAHAIDAFSRAIELEPSESSHWLGRAQANALRHATRLEAERDFARALELDSSNPEIFSARAKWRAQSGWNFALVLEDCRAARTLSSTNDLSAWEQLESESTNFGEAQWARANLVAGLDDALKREPSKATLLWRRAQTLARAGDASGARADCDALREIEGETTAYFQTLAPVLHLAGDWPGACDAAKQALSLQIEAGELSGEVDELIALSETESPRYKRAACLNLAVERAPLETRPLLARAAFFARWPERVEEAAADYNRAVEIAPHDPQVWEARGAFRVHRENWDVALDDFYQAVQLRIDSGEVARDATVLKARGDAIRAGRKRVDYDAGFVLWAHCHAFYSHAIETQPARHDLWLARAILKRDISARNGDWPFDDYLEALARKSSLKSARRFVEDTLVQRAQLDSAHERLEALIEARTLLESKLSACFVDEMMERIEVRASS